MAIAKSTKYESLDVYQAGLTPADLASVRRTLAKRANQRLLRLERASSKITGESYKQIGAAPLAYEYLERTGRRRFTEALKTKMSYEEQRREITAIQSFLRSKTSTVEGIREIERKRIETFEGGKWGSSKWTGKERRAIKFASTKEFYDFFTSSTFKDLLSSGFTSEQIVEAYDQARETFDGSDDDAIKALEEALETFRQKQRATLKDLMASVRASPLK